MEPLTRDGYYAQNVQEAVSSTLNFKLKRGDLRFNAYAGCVAYIADRVWDPVVVEPIQVDADFSEHRRSALIEGLDYPEVRSYNLTQLFQEWERLKISVDAFDLYPVADVSISRPTPRNKGGDELPVGYDQMMFAVPAQAEVRPASVLDEIWESSIRTICAVTGARGKFLSSLNPANSGTTVDVDFTEENATGMYILQRIQEKLASAMVGKSLLAQVASPEGGLLWGLQRFFIYAEAWTAEMKTPGRIANKIFLTRLFLDTLPVLKTILSTPYEFTYSEGHSNRITDRAIRILDQNVKCLDLISPMLYSNFTRCGLVDAWRVTSATGYWRISGAMDPIGIDYIATGLNMPIPEGFDEPRNPIASIMRDGLTFGGESADLVLPIGLSATRKNPGFIRTTAPPTELGIGISIPGSLNFTDPEAARRLVTDLREAYIKGQSTREFGYYGSAWMGGQILDDAYTPFGPPDFDTKVPVMIIDPATTREGGQIDAYTYQAGYSIKLTTPPSDTVLYNNPVFAQPELDKLAVSYTHSLVNFNTVMPFSLR